MNDYAFGNLIAALRSERGFSQFQLGRLLGVSDKAVSKWENGNAKPRMATCCRLADILGVSLDELLSTAQCIQSYQHSSGKMLHQECKDMTETKHAFTMRVDDADVKRIELHLRTGASIADGVALPSSYMNRAAQWGHTAIAVTDFCTVQSFPEAFCEAKKRGVKLIPGCEMMMLPADENDADAGYPIMLLATNREGMTNLNRLVSICLTQPQSGRYCVTRADIERHRQGLLVGSSCDGGEIMNVIRGQASWDELKNRAAFYDYLEVQPADLELDAYGEEESDAEHTYQDLVRTLIHLADESGKMVAAVGNARYIDPEDSISRAALQYNTGMLGAQRQRPHYYRTTTEMLQAFGYLGQEKAREIVVETPQRIADRIEGGLTLFPVHPQGRKTFMPIMPEAEHKIQGIIWNAAHEIYGRELPEIVESRMQKELAFIREQNSWPVFEIAHTVVCKSESDGYVGGTRGAPGASLIAFLLGITKVNPLPPHYVCPACKHSIFVGGNGDCLNGLDMETCSCPECGEEMRRDGFNIPCETFFGAHGEKLADIDLNISGYELDTVRRYLHEHYGRDHVYRAGTTGHVPYARAEKYLMQYVRDHGVNADKQVIAKAAEILVGTRVANGDHPAGLMFVPEDRDIYEFTPIHTLNASDGMVTTHFDVGLMNNVLLKMDVLGHDAPTLLHLMEKESGVKAESISINDNHVLDIFCSSEALGIEAESILSQTGVVGIPGFEEDSIQKLLPTIRTASIEELMRVFTMGHCLQSRREMMLELIEKEIAGIKDVPVFAEDILQKLLEGGAAYDEAYKAVTSIRLGREMTPEIETMMRNVKLPKWYIDVCRPRDYMFPRAHAASYVTNILKLGWYKLYHPQAFYAAWLTLHTEDLEVTDFELNDMQLRRTILAIKRDKMTEEEAAGYRYEDLARKNVLEVLLEMRVRKIQILHSEQFAKERGYFVADGERVSYHAG